MRALKDETTGLGPGGHSLEAGKPQSGGVIIIFHVGKHLVRVPNLYFGSRLGVQYPKNSKIFL